MRDWKAWAGVAISAFLLWWVFRDENLAEIGRQVGRADLRWLILAGSITTAGGLIRALRWRLLLEPLGIPVSLSARWRALNIGFAVTNLALGRLGELARPYALSKMTPITTSSALGTVVLERVLDTVALVVLLLVTLLSPAFPSDTVILGKPVAYAAWGAVGLAVMALVGVTMFVYWPEKVTNLARSVGGRLPDPVGHRISEAVESFTLGMGLLRSPQAVALTLLWSLGLWIWMSLSFWAAFRAFGLELGFTAALFTQCVVSVFVAIPAAPGFIGTLQAGVLVAVSGVWGVSEAEALSMSLGFHFSGYIPVTLLGLYYAWVLRIKVASVRREAELPEGSPRGTT